jgi:hypothetical protein
MTAGAERSECSAFPFEHSSIIAQDLRSFQEGFWCEDAFSVGERSGEGLSGGRTLR